MLPATPAAPIPCRIFRRVMKRSKVMPSPFPCAADRRQFTFSVKQYKARATVGGRRLSHWSYGGFARLAATGDGGRLNTDWANRQGSRRIKRASERETRRNLPTF